MQIKAICRTEKDAWKLSQLLKQDRRIGYIDALNQHKLDHCTLFYRIYWWKDDYDPENIPDDVYWQEDMPIEVFYNYILIRESFGALINQCVFENFLQKKFPDLNWEIHKEEHQFWVRLKTRIGGTFPVSLKVSEVHSTLLMLESIYKIQQYVQELSEQYPHLYFNPGTIEMPYTENGSKADTPYPWSVYVSQQGRDGTHTGYKFMWPMTEEIKQQLEELNTQAGLSKQGGWFFCTGCHKAKPKTDYEGFWFASSMCNECATPEWKKGASEEKYD